MRGSIGRLGIAALEFLLPSARAQACYDAYCEQSGARRRCCKICTGGVKVCSAWVTGSCRGFICHI